jgi:hypothetical protein
VFDGRHIDDKAAGQGNVRRDARTLLSNGFLGDLDDDFLAFFQEVRDGWQDGAFTIGALGTLSGNPFDLIAISGIAISLIPVALIAIMSTTFAVIGAAVAATVRPALTAIIGAMFTRRDRGWLGLRCCYDSDLFITGGSFGIWRLGVVLILGSGLPTAHFPAHPT